MMTKQERKAMTDLMQTVNTVLAIATTVYRGIPDHNTIEGYKVEFTNSHVGLYARLADAAGVASDILSR